MLNIARTVSIAKNFTKNGYRLLSKHINIPAAPANKIALPKNAVTMDVVQIESHFGEGLKKIVRFKDKDGKPIKHVMEEFLHNNRTGLTTRDYDRYGKILEINTTKVNGKGRTIENVKEAISVRWGQQNEAGQVIGTAPHAIRTKLKTTLLNDGSKQEHQVIEHLYTGSKRDYIETNAVRLQDGTLIKKGGSGNLPNTRELAEDPYLYIRNYSKQDFVKYAAPYAQREQQVAHRHITTKAEPISRETTLGYATTGGRVVIDVDKHITKMDIVDTLNHEMRHQYQFDKIKALDFWRSLIGKGRSTLNCEEKKAALKFFKAHVLYCPAFINKKLYRKNWLEVDARDAGAKAAEKFEEYSEKLARSFGAHREQYPLFQLENLAFKDALAEFIKNAPKVTIKNLNIKQLP